MIKKYLLPLLALILVITSSCSKENFKAPAIASGTAPWKGNPDKGWQLPTTEDQRDVSSSVPSSAIDTNVKLTIKRIEVAQLYSQEVNSQYQVLVPNRPTLVRVFIGNDQSSSPVKTGAKFLINRVETPFNCPDPGFVPTSSIDQNEYTNNKACTAKIDGSLIRPDMSITVQAGNQSKTVIPKVNNIGTTRVTVARSTFNGHTSKFVSDDFIKKAVERFLPVSEIVITRTDDIFTELTGCFDFGSIIEKKIMPMKYRGVYLVLTPGQDCNGGVSSVPYFEWNLGTSIGLPDSIEDNSDMWLTIHEFGHTFSAYHAPCGGPGDVDKIYYMKEWPNSEIGRISPTPIYDGVNIMSVASAAIKYQYNNVDTDVMGYCAGLWPSEYSLYNMARRVNNLPSGQYLIKYASTGLPEIAKSSAESNQFENQVPYIVFTGSINNGVVKLKPIFKSTAFDMAKVDGDYSIEITNSNNQKIKQSFKVMPVHYDDRIENQEVGHEHSFYFYTAMPDPGIITDIKMFYGFSELKILNKPNFKQATIAASSMSLSSLVRVSYDANEYKFKWNNKSYPYLRVTKIDSNGQRDNLKLQAEGGEYGYKTAKIDSCKWELQLSDGINSQTTIIDCNSFSL